MAAEVESIPLAARVRWLREARDRFKVVAIADQMPERHEAVHEVVHARQALGQRLDEIETHDDRGPVTYVMCDPEGNEFCVHPVEQRNLNRRAAPRLLRRQRPGIADTSRNPRLQLPFRRQPDHIDA